MADTLSAADIMALNNQNNGMGDIWNNPFIYLVWFALLGGNGGGLFGGGNAAAQGALTRAELSDGLGRQDIMRNQDNIQAEIGAFERDATNMWGNIRYDNLQGVCDLKSALAENRFSAQQCCCETNRNIDSVKHENYHNTNEIVNALHREGEETRALINSNTVQNLRDRLSDRDRDLQSANLLISQYQQNNTLIEALRPVSKPAYITCSPYTSNTCGQYPC